jgi:hypothetical protein
VNGVLLRPLAYRDPDRLMLLRETSPDFSTMSIAYPNFVDWKFQKLRFWIAQKATDAAQPLQAVTISQQLNPAPGFPSQAVYHFFDIYSQDLAILTTRTALWRWTSGVGVSTSSAHPARLGWVNR